MKSEVKRYITLFTLFGLLTVAFVMLTAGTDKVSAQQPSEGCWATFSSPGPAGQSHQFRAVEVISPDDVWAVGIADVEAQKWEPLIAHWNGSTWSRVPGPRMERSATLYGVSGTGKNDVWAVGITSSTELENATFIMHWNGTAWSVVPSPNFGSESTVLRSVAAIAPDDAWAVGSYRVVGTGGREYERAAILHWDGRAWALANVPDVPRVTATVPIPPEIPIATSLSSVSATSKDDVWAVGYGPNGSLMMHWDGSAWNVVPISGQRLGGRLDGVTAVARDDAWAVGLGTILHWDGRAWTHAAENPGAGSITLFQSIAAISKNDVWAVGVYQPDRRGGQLPILYHWNGQRWAQEANPVSFAVGEFHGVKANGDTLWVVGQGGTSALGPTQGVLMRYSSGPCSQATPTAGRPLNPPVPVPGSGSYRFPETGKTMTGVFLNYWQQNGGVPQQGFPISEVMGEMSDLDGKLYTMQYSERAVFEYHPENKPPFNVLLSQLGTFQYRKNYSAYTPEQKPNNEPGSILFKETGKRLGGAFLKYWREHGDLMQQGYPITDEFTEVSDLNRRPYTVQYFERAVFEYHPENKGTQYEVLLSHLGRFRWNEKYSRLP